MLLLTENTLITLVHTNKYGPYDWEVQYYSVICNCDIKINNYFFVTGPDMRSEKIRLLAPEPSHVWHY